MTRVEARLWIAAGLSWAAFFVLGYRVTHGPPIASESLAPLLFGRATAFAEIMTWTGYSPFIIAAAVALALLFLVRSKPLTALFALLALQLASQAAAAAVKLPFHRARPNHWLVREDAGYSYPSGHATTALVFYGGLLVLLAASEAPRPAKTAGCAALALWIVGICWSRIALGAHYPSDVLGGALFGLGFLCAGLAIVRHRRRPAAAEH
jgi:undecaprenyl-diphosphatase